MKVNRRESNPVNTHTICEVKVTQIISYKIRTQQICIQWTWKGSSCYCEMVEDKVGRKRLAKSKK